MQGQQIKIMIHRLLLALVSFSVIFPAAVVSGMTFPEPNPPVQYRDLPESRATIPGRLSKSGSIEWIFHKTEDGEHPNGMEQQQLWFVNRARSNPTEEGIWLATESDPDVSWGRDGWRIDPDQLKAEFAAIAAKPPAVFDRRLYEAARLHSEDLIERDAQDHDGQSNEVDESGFFYRAWSGVVYSYSLSGLSAHAGFNIDWGRSAAGDGMQDPRGHRQALMAISANYMNVGIASVPVDPALGKEVGPFVTTGNYAEAYELEADHYNTFIVGTVWTDFNGNGIYDPGEGHGGLTVAPSLGNYFSITSDSGGYAIPITDTGSAEISFSGGNLFQPVIFETDLGLESILVDFTPLKYFRDADGDGFGDATASLLSSFQPDGYSSDNSDCDDTDLDTHPGQTWYRDGDDDGYSDGTTDMDSCMRLAGYKTAAELLSDSIDCDDTRADIYPGAVEDCDGIDNNCNTEIDEGVTPLWFRDNDGDGFGNPDDSLELCDSPAGYGEDNTDCDDNDLNAYPGQVWHKDADDDGYSDGTTDMENCIRPVGYKASVELISSAVDEDDNDSSVFPLSDYLLTVKISGTIVGVVTSDPVGVDCGETCSGKFPKNTLVTLTAQVMDGRGVVQWSVPACADMFACKIEMTADMEVSVEFKKKFPWTMFFPVFTRERIQ